MGSNLNLLLLAFLLFSTACHAKIRHPSHHKGYSVHVEDTYGRSLQSFVYQGKTYVMGHYNNRYRVRIRNHTGHRIEAVVSVDGRDVISGELGSFEEQRGYLVDGHSSVLIDGFRQSDQNVASFRFTTPGDSYSARMGTPQHLGVIGVAVFRERSRPRPVQVAPAPQVMGPTDTGQSAEWETGAGGRGMGTGGGGVASASSRKESNGRGMNRPQKLGTKYGETRYSPIEFVAFVRANSRRPATILAVYYDNESGLISRGIRTRPPAFDEPSPFPRQVRYAPPPP